MRSRLWSAVVAVVIFALYAPRMSAQDAGGGIGAGDYLRVGAGIATPVNASGSLREWDRGTSFSLMWENWAPGPTGGGSRVAFGIGGVYSRLPLKEAQFMSDFKPAVGTTSSASGTAALYEVNSTIRIRLPAPYVLPAVSLGFGFLDWAPGAIHYTTSTGGSGTAKQEHRAGAELAFGGSLDVPVMDRYSIFGEAQYVYGFTAFGSGFASASGTCLTSSCDPLKNTSIATLRGGLRVRIAQ